MKYYVIQGVRKNSNSEEVYRLASKKENIIKDFFEKTVSVSLVEEQDYYGFFKVYPELNGE